jgi:hypothetical protein
LKPEYPAAHAQLYRSSDTPSSLPADSEHTPLFAHGVDEHSFVSTSQLPPSGLFTAHCAVYCEMYPVAHKPFAKPATHWQWYALLATFLPVESESTHAAPFAHGFDAHSFTSVAQLKPEYPAAHAQLYRSSGTPSSLPADSEHTPLFAHGVDEHSFVSAHVLPSPVYPSRQRH